MALDNVPLLVFGAYAIILVAYTRQPSMFLKPEINFQIYCKGSKVSFLPKLILKLLFLGAKAPLGLTSVSK